MAWLDWETTRPVVPLDGIANADCLSNMACAPTESSAVPTTTSTIRAKFDYFMLPPWQRSSLLQDVVSGG